MQIETVPWLNLRKSPYAKIAVKTKISLKASLKLYSLVADRRAAYLVGMGRSVGRGGHNGYFLLDLSLHSPFKKEDDNSFPISS